MVKIRLARHGSKKRPYYRIVVADSRFSRDGRYIERIGAFNPCARGLEQRLEIDHDRMAHWVKQGAQPTLRVAELAKKDKAAAGKEAKPALSRNEMKKQQAEAAKSKLAKAKAPEADKEEAAADAETASDESAE